MQANAASLSSGSLLSLSFYLFIETITTHFGGTGTL